MDADTRKKLAAEAVDLAGPSATGLQILAIEHALVMAWYAGANAAMGQLEAA